MNTSDRQTVLVTGASSGIGLELARVFAREGFDLVLTARRLEALNRLRSELDARTVRIRTFAADLAVADGAESLMRDIVGAGVRIDVLVNNAGVGLYGAFVETSLEEEQRMIQLNVTSLVTLTKLLLPDMIERRGGAVLNVASTAAFVPGPRMAVYYATKAFVLSFSEALADELRDTGVTITVLCPGPTASGFQETARMHRTRLTQGAMMDSRTVAEAGYRGLIAGTRLVIPGIQNRAVPLLARVLPRRVMTVLSRRAAEVA
jgi:uncharacterized protein